MVNIDPRSKPQLSVESINGVITDRAIELLNMLNNAIGAEGNTGIKNTELVFTDQDGSKNQALGNHLIAPSDDDAQWKEEQVVYFQASHSRIDTVSRQLQRSLDEMQDGLVDNISNLFSTLAAKENDNRDGKKSINELEQELNNAQTTEEIFAAQAALEARANELLTSEEAMNQIIDLYFESFNLNIETINENIFNKLHDFDDDYANGKTEIEEQKFFFQRGYTMPGEDSAQNQPVLILNTKEEVFNQLLEDQKTLHEAQYGAGTYGQGRANEFVQNEVEIKFVRGDLKLSDEVIAMIIADKNLSDEDLANISNMTDFLEMISFTELLGYTNSSSDQEALNSLYTDHLAITTPKYYKDQRSIYDILNGKDNDINSGNTTDRIFSSVNSQMTNLAQGVEDLMRNGYDKVADSNLQIAIRNDPFSAMEYLEGKRDTVSGVFLELLDEQIDILSSRQVRQLKNYAEDLVKERRDIRLSDNVDEARIEEINELISKMADLEIQLRHYDASQNTDTRARLQEIFPDKELASFSNDLAHSTFTNAMDVDARYSKASQLLYVMEDTESNKKNSEYYTRKLPEPQADGTIPEETMPIPPLMSPSPLSAVIAKIGDEMVAKSRELAKGDSIPTTQWMEDNTSTLLNINDQLSDLGANSAGEAFLTNLKETFKDVIKDFFNSNNPKKTVQDEIKTEIETTMERQQELTALEAGNIDIHSRNFNAQVLRSIETALGNNIKSGNNFVNRAGLDEIKDYLEENVNELEQINFNQEINQRLDEIEDINDKIRDGTATDQDRARLNSLQSQIIQLRADENNLEKAQELLYGEGGSQNNIQEGSITEISNTYNRAIDRLIRDKGGLSGDQTRSNFLDSLEDAQADDYKEAVQDYSDSLTDFGSSDIENAFREALETSDLDLDGNGENDFVDIQNMVDRLDDLSENITNTFGGKEATEGGIAAQSIRRMILLMFVFSILEAGQYQQRKDDADVSRYAIG